MNTIILNTNDLTGRSKTVNVSDKILTKLEGLEYAGGFKRFSIDIYDDKIKNVRKSDFIDLFIFLSWVFVTLNCKQIEALIKN